jgi:hypothetical protein
VLVRRGALAAPDTFAFQFRLFPLPLQSPFVPMWTKAPSRHAGYRQLDEIVQSSGYAWTRLTNFAREIFRHARSDAVSCLAQSLLKY